MSNRNFVICGRMYVVDVNVCDFATSLLLTQSQKLENQEIKVRIVQSVILRAIGLEAMLSIPASDFAEATLEIFKILLENSYASSN